MVRRRTGQRKDNRYRRGMYRKGSDGSWHPRTKKSSLTPKGRYKANIEATLGSAITPPNPLRDPKPTSIQTGMADDRKPGWKKRRLSPSMPRSPGQQQRVLDRADVVIDRESRDPERWRRGAGGEWILLPDKTSAKYMQRQDPRWQELYGEWQKANRETPRNSKVIYGRYGMPHMYTPDLPKPAELLELEKHYRDLAGGRGNPGYRSADFPGSTVTAPAETPTGIQNLSDSPEFNAQVTARKEAKAKQDRLRTARLTTQMWDKIRADQDKIRAVPEYRQLPGDLRRQLIYEVEQRYRQELRDQLWRERYPDRGPMTRSPIGRSRGGGF